MRAAERSQRLGAGLATAWLLLAVATDMSIASDIVLAPLYAISALIACALLRPWVTAGFAAAALGFTILSAQWNDTWGEPQHLVRIVDVALVGGAAVVIAVVRGRREERFARVSEIARVAQRIILPTLPRRVGHVALGARYLSSTEDAVVGGDFFDFYHAGSMTRLVIGDVRGKGLAAVEQAGRAIRAFRQAAASHGDLAETAVEISTYMMPFLDDEEFITALLVDLSSDGQVTVVSCGHPMAVLLTDRGATHVEAPAGLPLGLGRSYEEHTVGWEPGDRLLLYTDGLSEARDAEGEFLAPLDLAPVLRHGDVEQALDGVLAAVQDHVSSDDLGDDLAVLLVENSVRTEQTPQFTISRESLTGAAVGSPAGLAVRPPGHTVSPPRRRGSRRRASLDRPSRT